LEVLVVRIFWQSLLIVLFFSASAHADDRAKARAAFRAGSQHYNLGEFQQALESFREAYRRYEEPTFLYNIAQCERQLGHKREAIREYRAYLNNAQSADNREAVKQIILQIEREIAADDERAAKAAAAAEMAKPSAPTLSATPSPPPPTPTAATTLTAGPPHPAEHKPAYKKWWVWTLVGTAVAGGAAAGLAVALTRTGAAPTVNTVLGTAHPF